MSTDEIAPVARVDKLSKLRSNARASVTLRCRALQRMVAECVDGQSVAGKFEELRASFDTFEEAHHKYVNEAGVGEDEAEQYYDTVHSRYLDCVAFVQLSGLVPKDPAYAVSAASNPVPDGNVASAAADPVSPNDKSEWLYLLNFDKAKLRTFGGDISQYHEFRQMFVRNIEQHCKNDDLRLTRLSDCLTGEPLHSIKVAEQMGGVEGYEKAWEVLDKRYGDAYAVSMGLLTRLKAQVPAHSASALRELGDLLFYSIRVFSDLKTTVQLDNQSVIQDICKRLPDWLRRKWATKTFKHRQQKDNDYLGIDDLAAFVSGAADAAHDPLYGSGSAVSSKAKTSSSGGGGKVSNVMTEERGQASSGQSFVESTVGVSPNSGVRRNKFGPSEDVPACMHCQSAHWLWQCRAYKDTSPAQRKSLVDKLKLCCICLRANHGPATCPKSYLKCLVCRGKHNTLLHIDGGASHALRGNTCYMPIVRARLNGKVTVNCLLDTGSSHTLCSEAVVQAAGLCKSDAFVSLSTVHGTQAYSGAVKFSLSSLEDGSCHQLAAVLVVEDIPIVNCPLNQSMYPYLSGLNLAGPGCDDVQVLIGLDNAHLLVPLDVRRGLPSQPFAQKSVLGWALYGRSIHASTNNVVVSNFVTAFAETSRPPPHDLVHKLWAIENEGVEGTGMSVQDKRVIDLWDSTCTKDGEHYVLPIPWKDRTVPLPDNEFLAKKRLHSTKKRLDKLGLYERYDSEIQGLLSNGYAEIAPSVPEESDRVWYIPHHAVHNPRKPDKLRVVFDCAAKCGEGSLNDRCLQGPDLVNRLFAVLLRFRLGQLGVQADISAMYHQVRVPPCDRDALRFLWFLRDKIVHYRMTSHLFGGVWCASVSAYALQRTIRDLPSCDPLVEDAVLRNTYVDDCLQSVDSVSEVMHVIREVPKALRTGGFHLTKFVVSDEAIMKAIPTCDRAKEVHDFSEDSVGRALGVKWAVAADQFFFEAPALPEEQLTRRSLLSYVSSVFDPLGLVSPMILEGKLIFQKATRHGLGWDDAIPVDLSQRWSLWTVSLEKLKARVFPRCVSSMSSRGTRGSTQLHVFADASSVAYGAAVYLRSQCGEQVRVELLVSKSRVAPMNQVTIPRLELQAAVLAVRLFAAVSIELGLRDPLYYLWTDSAIVLGYIRNVSRRFHVFVENRVSEIRSTCEVAAWRHVGSKDNPADFLSKVRDLDDDSSWSLWRHGPQWLLDLDAPWSSSECARFELPANDPEVVSLAIVEHETPVPWFGSYLFHFSDWVRMCIAVAWLMRYVRFCRDVVDCPRGPLSVDEISLARTRILTGIQHEAFAKEISELTAGKHVSRNSSLLSLDPFLDQSGLLRVGGRTRDHPIVIPKKSAAAIALLWHYHTRGHVGCEWTLSLVAKRYWIVGGRALCKSLIKSCVRCRRLYAKPLEQKMAALPDERLKPFLPAFSHTGLDVFGPYTIKRGRTEVKRYGCVFTCFVVRAVHIEVLESLDVDAFVNAFRRFIARRGEPVSVTCDNGTNLVAGEKELRLAFAKHATERLEQYCKRLGIKWAFIPPHAPHFGGVWERMVGVIKRVLKTVINSSSRVTEDVLTTVFAEAEAIVNSRPLCKLSDDSDDFTPLTPNHLLLLHRGVSIPPAPYNEANLYRKRWLCAQHLADEFWRRWIQEYLPTLQHRSKWTIQRPLIVVNDFVLLKEPNIPRYLWPLGIVSSVHVGSDGLVREVVVRTRTSELRRPIAKIILLEGAGLV